MSIRRASLMALVEVDCGGNEKSRNRNCIELLVMLLTNDGRFNHTGASLAQWVMQMVLMPTGVEMAFNF